MKNENEKKKLSPIAFYSLWHFQKKKILEGRFLCGLVLTKLIT